MILRYRPLAHGRPNAVAALVTAVLAVFPVIHFSRDKLLCGRSVDRKLHILHSGTSRKNSLLVQYWQLSAKNLGTLLDHELDEGRDLVLDDVQACAWPEEARSEADGEVNGVHAVDFMVL